MKTIKPHFMIALLAAAIWVPALSWPEEPTAALAQETVIKSSAEKNTSLDKKPEVKPADNKSAAKKTAPNKTATNKNAAPTAVNGALVNGEGIRLNFRGVTLDTVLDYMSQAAGFVIVKETQVEGTVDVFSHQPLSKDEAVELLNTVLNEKGYAAVRNERTLTIVRRDDARLKDLRVQMGSNPDHIPKTDEMITQVIPVLHTDATKLLENLQPLINSSYATISANESSNAVIVTDTQKNIHRLTEIIQALDSSISSISDVRVFTLKYADAKQLATVITEVFKVDTTSGNQRRGGSFPMPPFMGGGGGRGGDQGGGQSSGQSEAKSAAARVVAVADERTNSLVVTAAEELMPVIEKLVNDVDQVTEDTTEISVFHLKYADATEMEQVITDLFPQTSTSSSSSGGSFAPRFGGMTGGPGGMMGGPGGMMGGPGGMMGGGMGGARGGSSSQTGVSQRQLQQTTVRAVADVRTNSIIIYAGSETMGQIKRMITELDASKEKKQNVYVYKLEHADVENVETILRNIFETNNYNTSNRQTNSNSNQNTLSNRTVTTTNSLSSGRTGGSSSGN